MNSEALSKRALRCTAEEQRPVRADGMLAIIACLCVLACSAAAQAQHVSSEHSESAAQSTEYRELIEQALSEFKHKNWPESRVLFRRAHELSPSARTLRGIGMVSYEMRDYVNAVVALTAALADSRQALTDTQKKECETLLARSRTFVGAYTLKLEPPQADVTLDGAALARDHEGRVLVPFGEHTLRAVATGFQDSTSKLSVQGGEQGELRVVLYRPQALATAVPASSVEKTVTSEAPRIAEPPPPRVHSEPASDRFIGHGIRYSWITLGATAAFGAAAAAVWFSGQKKVDDLDSACARAASVAPCQRGQVDTAGVERHEHGASALLGLAGASLVATGVLMALEWPTERRSEQNLSVQLSPQRLSVRGSF